MAAQQIIPNQNQRVSQGQGQGQAQFSVAPRSNANGYVYDRATSPKLGTSIQTVP